MVPVLSDTRSPMKDFTNASVTVMGLGRFGGGLGVTRWLCEQGAEVLVTDQADAASLNKSVEALADLEAMGSVRFRLGKHHVSDFTTCDAVVVNPAVKPDNRFVRAAQAAGIGLLTEIGLLIERLPCRENVIGITGSAGKSTTAAMTHHLLTRLPEVLSQGGTAWLGGNIGGSLLPHLADIRDTDAVVLELSSFMLHYLQPLAWSPGVAVITNIQPNHLDWHGSFEAYRDAKVSIARHANAGDTLIRGEDIAPLTFDLPIPGVHNQHNASIATRTVESHIGRQIEAHHLCQAFSTFQGLPHRLQRVHQASGIRCFNDSKSTTPQAAMLAIDAFAVDTASSAPRIHIILGGADKGSDLKPLARHAADHCAAIYTIGTTGPELHRHVLEHRPQISSHACETLQNAVTQAAANLHPGDVLLLSPGCASWDQFDHYEQRGEMFTQLVQALLNK